jgi:hypothetical protein
MNDTINRLTVDYCNRLSRGIEALKRQLIAESVDDYIDLHHVLVAAQNELYEYQKMVADAAAPYFEVQK